MKHKERMLVQSAKADIDEILGEHKSGLTEKIRQGQLGRLQETDLIPKEDVEAFLGSLYAVQSKLKELLEDEPGDDYPLLFQFIRKEGEQLEAMAEAMMEKAKSGEAQVIRHCFSYFGFIWPVREFNRKMKRLCKGQLSKGERTRAQREDIEQDE